MYTKERRGSRRGGYSSYAWLHLHILLRIVARLAANRKMRHRQRADIAKERQRQQTGESETARERELVLARVVFACLIRFELAGAVRKYVCQMLNQPHTLKHTRTHTPNSVWQTKQTSERAMHKYFNSILFGYVH